MPTEVIIKNQKFFNQLKNGIDFSQNLSDYTPNLVGNIGDRIRHEFEIDIRWYVEASTSLQLTISATSTRIQRNIGSWIEDGFSIGDRFNIGHPTLGSDVGCVITAISENIIYYTPPLTILIIDGTYTNIVIYGTSPLTALQFNYNLINNDDDFTPYSIINGNELMYYGVNIGYDTGGGVRSTTAVNLIKQGTFNDLITCNQNIFKHTCAYVSTDASFYYAQKFKIVFDFIITPFYLDNWKTDFDNNTVPQELTGLNSFKSSFNGKFLTGLSNPNSGKEFTHDTTLGSTGYYNENFNGFNNNYNLVSISYKDSNNNALSGVTIDDITTVTVTVSKTIGTFNADESAGVFIAYCAKQNEYTNTIATLEDNFIYDNAIAKESYTKVDGINGIIKDFTVNIQSGKLVYEFKVDYSITQKLRLNNTLKYIIGIQVGDMSIAAINSDRVTLLSDYNNYIGSSESEEFVSGERLFGLFTHPMPIDLMNDKVFNRIELHNELGFAVFWGIFINNESYYDDLLHTKNVQINTLTHKVIAYNDVTNEYFELESYPVEINNYKYSTTPTGSIYKEIFSDYNRGYKLDESDEKNTILINTRFASYLVDEINNAYYNNVCHNIIIPQKVPWQSWIKNINANQSFKDFTKENNNLNYKTSNYSTGDWKIRFGLLINVTGDAHGETQTIDYLMLSCSMNCNDYEHTSSPWSAEIETFDEDGNNLQGSILKNANTLFRTTWTRNGDFREGYAFWGIHRLEPVNSPTQNEIYEISSLYEPIDECPLRPLSGYDYLRLVPYVNDDIVITECIIDYTMIDPNIEYKLSAHLDDGIGSGYIGDNGLITEDGINYITDEEGNVIMAE